MLNSPSACQRYITTHRPQEIAQQLRHDQERCRAGQLPSLLALTLPKASSRLADEISLYLLKDENPACAPKTTPRSLRQLQYEGALNGIRAYLDQLGQDVGEGFSISGTVPTTQDFAAALKVLEYFQANPKVAHLKPTSPLAEIVTAVKTQLSLPPELRTAYRSSSSPGSRAPKRKRRKCYMCQFLIVEPHALYTSLCKPCGDFNLAESDLSLPGSLSLEGKVALVTGGRVALGLHTALRLLRCGAKVIVSSRYPRDAESRYREESDFDDWAHRLRIVGADFRTARDVFRLVAVAKQILMEWGPPGSEKSAQLYLLVNNAAQTLTDSLAEEEKAIVKEQKLLAQTRPGALLCHKEAGYEARIRGGNLGLDHEMIDREMMLEDVTDDNIIDGNPRGEIEAPQENKGDSVITTLFSPSNSSWVQTLQDIPYEDVITAHSVNTFVPFILTRELLPLMSAQSRPPSKSSTKPPIAHIINVSSREGIFESTPKASSKNGHHVHTNMSKAALNMLTETEAARTWRQHCIAMVTVDPGYMSAAPEFRTKGECPIGFDDGAARVLWPVAVAEIRGETVWGRFLKHFGEVKVDVGKGR